MEVNYTCLPCGLGSFLVHMSYKYSFKLCSYVIQLHVLTVVCAALAWLELQGTWAFLLFSMICCSLQF